MLECLLCFSISPYFSTYDETLVSDFGFQVSVGDPFYAFASYEKPSLKRVGQSIGSLELPSLGVGYRYKWLFLEFSHYWPSNDWDSVIEHEVVGTMLRNDHGDPGWRAEHFSYELEPGWGGRIGVSAPLTERFSVWGAYRFLSLRESLDMCTGIDASCSYPVDGKHWQNRDTLSLSSVQIGFSIRL